jgi:type II secretory pathway pseudopilin PulG
VNCAFKKRRRLEFKRNRQRQGGYAIMLVLLMATLMLIATMAVAPNILNQGRREREEEMVWRGNQYKRGIKMYYRKTGKFPTSLEDLIKPKIGNIRFMRQAYKDPMNAKDGDWRLIYVGPAGQLIGSLKSQRALQLTGLGGFQNMAAPNIGAPNMPGGQQPFGQSLGQPFGQGSQMLGNPAGNTAGGMQNPQSQLGAVSADTTGPGGLGSGDAPDSDAAANEALLNSDPPKIMGGNIIGVGSKINQKSLQVYEKAKNYRQFEFIWDPSKDVMTFGSTPPAGSTPLGQQPQQAPFGQQGTTPPSAPANPDPMPPETTPEPPQEP